MRTDRFITVVAHRLRSSNGATGRLPVLMYHSIDEDPEQGVGPYYRLATSPARFARQMEILASAGIRGVTLSEGWRWLRDGAAGEPRVAITFDDGFRSFHDAAFPALARHRFSATVYLPTAFISDPRQRFKGKECMTWSEVLDLHRQGIEFGGHTLNHPKLYDLAWPEIRKELSESRRTIEDRLQTAVAAFAYPYAFPQEDRAYVERLCTLLRELDYQSSVTTVIGTARPRENPFALPRLPVNGADDDDLFKAKLGGAYDWLRVPQRWARQLRSLRGAGRKTDL